jgi:DnaK suppressor protein
MTRRIALLRLHKILLARRERLSKKVVGESAYQHGCNTTHGTGDSADSAFEAEGGEMSARLAGSDTRDLSQIEGALLRWKQGTYGICERCQKLISLPRLNALPCAPLCISCEREMEKSCAGQARQHMSKWSQVSDAQTSMQDQQPNLSEMERELSGSGRG